MKRVECGRLIACLVVSAMLIAGGAFAASGPNLRKIVVFNEGTSGEVKQGVAAAKGSKVHHTLSLVHAMAIELPDMGPEETLAFLRAHPAVQRIEDDPVVTIQGAGSDGAGSDRVFVTWAPAPVVEFYPWGIDWIGAAQVQEDNPKLAGYGVTVALIGTGVATHPELHVIGGYNAIAGQDPHNWQDDNGHDTHVAGTMAAQLNNQGVIGVAPRLKIYALKALDRYGKGYTSDVIMALQHVQQEHPDIRIIAGSFGTDLVWPSFQDAIYRMYQLGKLMVFSAGNRCAPDGAQGAGSDGAGSDAACVLNPSDLKFPARYPWVIAVGASDGSDHVPPWSRSGSAMADHGVVAPGVDIFSTNLGRGYGWMSGTSPAAPHVTGAVALALQLQRDLSYEDLLALLRRTAKNTGAPANVQGAGRIDVEKLVNRLMHK